jgi:hypothetical protein
MDQTSLNREFVKRHFEAVNRREVQTVLGNMRPDLYDPLANSCRARAMAWSER